MGAHAHACAEGGARTCTTARLPAISSTWPARTSPSPSVMFTISAYRGACTMGWGSRGRKGRGGAREARGWRTVTLLKNNHVASPPALARRAGPPHLHVVQNDQGAVHTGDGCVVCTHEKRTQRRGTSHGCRARCRRVEPTPLPTPVSGTWHAPLPPPPFAHPTPPPVPKNQPDPTCSAAQTYTSLNIPRRGFRW